MMCKIIRYGLHKPLWTVFLIMVSCIAITGVSMAIPITGPTEITTPGYYSLENDIVCPADDYSACINIRSNNVVLDGKGHTIYGIPGSGSDVHSNHGIRVGASNIEIRNLTVQDFFGRDSRRGINLIERINNINIRDVNLSNNHIGYYDDRGIENVVLRDSVLNNNTYGIYSTQTAYYGYAKFYNNLIINNRMNGLLLVGANNVSVHSNLFDNNTYAGLCLDGNTNNNKI